jgi:hypothetical protein
VKASGYLSRRLIKFIEIATDEGTYRLFSCQLELCIKPDLQVLGDCLGHVLVSPLPMNREGSHHPVLGFILEGLHHDAYGPIRNREAIPSRGYNLKKNNIIKKIE